MWILKLLRQLSRNPVGGFFARAKGAFAGEPVEIVATEVERRGPSGELLAQSGHFAQAAGRELRDADVPADQLDEEDFAAAFSMPTAAFQRPLPDTSAWPLQVVLSWLHVDKNEHVQSTFKLCRISDLLELEAMRIVLLAEESFESGFPWGKWHNIFVPTAAL